MVSLPSLSDAILKWVPVSEGGSTFDIQTKVVNDHLGRGLKQIDIKVCSVASVFLTLFAISLALSAPLVSLLLLRMDYAPEAFFTPLFTLAIAYAFQCLSHYYKDTASTSHYLAHMDFHILSKP